jgi:photosystem II stability/assembly factor-like uncharacterized protein
MPRALLSLALVLFAVDTRGLTWTTHGPRGGAIVAVAISASAPQVIYAASGAGVFRSSDAGDTWVDVSGPLHDVTHLAVDPTNANILYAASLQSVWKTTDGGMSWTKSSSGLTSSPLATALLIDPHHPSTLYYGSGCRGSFEPYPNDVIDSGLYKSTDSGATWRLSIATNLNDHCVQEATLDPDQPQHLFRNMVYSPVQESYDATEDWTIAGTLAPTRVVVDDPRSPLTRYGASQGLSALLKSDDGGLTWYLVAAEGLPKHYVPDDLAVDRTSGRLFIVMGDSLFRSGNGGASWLQIDVPHTQARHIVVDEGAGYLFLATNGGLYRAPLATLGPWSLMNVGDGGTNVSSVAVDPRDPSIVYSRTRDFFNSAAQTGHGRILRSNDFGRNWQTVHEGDDTPMEDTRVAVDANGSVITVFSRPNVSSVTARLMRLDPLTGATTDLNLPIGALRAVVADPYDANTIYAANYGAIYTTHDGGATWRIFTTDGTMTIAIDPTDRTRVFAGSRTGIWKSVDGGMTWTSISPLWGERVAFALSHPSTVYRVTQTPAQGGHYGVLWRSDDSGDTWTQLGWPGENSTTNAMAVDPRDHRSLWLVSGYYGMYHSSDAGVTWQQAIGNLPSIPIDLVIDKQGMMMHAATSAFGVWDAPLTTRRRATRQ